jgi:hypothetical protein
MTSSPHLISDTILTVTCVTPTGTGTTGTAPGSSVTIRQGFKTVAATGTPEAMVSTSTLVSSVVIQGYKAQGTMNTGNVYIGGLVTDAVDPIAIVPGGSLTIDAPPGKYIDLASLYIDVATAADGVGYFGVV